MNRYASCHTTLNQSNLKLNSVLQMYKQQEINRSLLKNKINVIRQQCESNRNRTKMYQNNVSKIKSIKDSYNKDKVQIHYLLQNQKENHKKKIAREKQKRNQNRGSLQVIKNVMAEQKKKQYNKVKEGERRNQFLITKNWKKSLHSKQQRSLQVRLNEQKAKLTRALFMQQKILKTHRQSQKQLQPLQFGVSENKELIEYMKRIQKQMIVELETSRANLRKSKQILQYLEQDSIERSIFAEMYDTITIYDLYKVQKLMKNQQKSQKKVFEDEILQKEDTITILTKDFKWKFDVRIQLFSQFLQMMQPQQNQQGSLMAIKLPSFLNVFQQNFETLQAFLKIHEYKPQLVILPKLNIGFKWQNQKTKTSEFVQTHLFQKDTKQYQNLLSICQFLKCRLIKQVICTFLASQAYHNYNETKINIQLRSKNFVYDRLAQIELQKRMFLYSKQFSSELLQKLKEQEQKKHKNANLN